MSNDQISFISLELLQLKRDSEDIAGEWNGDEAGEQEDKAHVANDIIKKVDALLDSLNEMAELNN